MEVLATDNDGVLVRVTSDCGRECAILKPMYRVPPRYVIKMKRVVQPQSGAGTSTETARAAEGRGVRKPKA